MARHDPEEDRRRRERERREEKAVVFKEAPEREGKKRGFVLPAREAPELVKGEIEERKKEDIEARRPDIARELGTGELRAELQQQIDQPLSLEPT